MRREGKKRRKQNPFTRTSNNKANGEKTGKMEEEMCEKRRKRNRFMNTNNDKANGGKTEKWKKKCAKTRRVNK